MIVSYVSAEFRRVLVIHLLEVLVSFQLGRGDAQVLIPEQDLGVVS